MARDQKPPPAAPVVGAFPPFTGPQEDTVRRAPATDKKTYIREYMRTYRSNRDRVRLEMGAVASGHLAIVRAAGGDVTNVAAVERLLAREAAAVQAAALKAASGKVAAARGSKKQPASAADATTPAKRAAKPAGKAQPKARPKA